MQDLNTKQKIILSAVKLFNEYGMANVRLQQIASEIGISTGNLAYHYKNKEAIIEAVYIDLYEELDDILSTYRVFPNLIDFDHQLSKYYDFILKYPFYFLDLLEIERNYPDILSKRRNHIGKMISQFRKRFDYNQKRGLIIEEPREGTFDKIADTIWVIISFWVPQRLIRGNQNDLEVIQLKELIWTQIYPYFTEKGKQEFDQLIIPMLKKQN